MLWGWGVFPNVTHLSHTSLSVYIYICENLIANEYHAVIPACDTVAPFLVQPTTLSELINCTSSFIEIFSEFDILLVSTGPSSCGAALCLGCWDVNSNMLLLYPHNFTLCFNWLRTQEKKHNIIYFIFILVVNSIL